MLFNKAPHDDVNDYDIDVLVAMAKHGAREQDIRNWEMLALVDVQGTLIMAKTPLSPMASMIPPDDALGYMATASAEQMAEVKAGAEVDMNGSMKKYVIGIGIMYQAAMVKEGEPGADALIQEAEVMGSVRVTEPVEGHTAIHHVLVRHLNGLFYSHWLPVEGDWEMDMPQVRIDTKENADTFGMIGAGLNALVDALEYFSDRKEEVRCG